MITVSYNENKPLPPMGLADMPDKSIGEIIESPQAPNNVGKLVLRNWADVVSLDGEASWPLDRITPSIAWIKVRILEPGVKITLEVS